MFKGVEHTAIASPDPRTLAQWYVEHLEFIINYEYAGNYFVKPPTAPCSRSSPVKPLPRLLNSTIPASAIWPFWWTISTPRIASSRLPAWASSASP